MITKKLEKLCYIKDIISTEFFYFSSIRDLINSHFLIKTLAGLLGDEYNFNAFYCTFLDRQALSNFVSTKSTACVEVKNLFDEMDKKSLDELCDHYAYVLNKLSYFNIKF